MSFGSGGKLDSENLIPTPQNVSTVMQQGRHVPAPVQPKALGDVMAPSAPMAGGDAPDFEAKVKRNESFLMDPSVQSSLIDFAVQVLSPGMSTKEQQEQQKIDLASRQFGVETELAQQRIGIDYEELKLKRQELQLKGGKKYSKLVTGESPMGMELGLAKGQRARVEFQEDNEGNIVSASVQDNPQAGEGDKPTQISKLNQEADAAEAAGNMPLARQLRMAADTEATGASWQGTTEPGTQIVSGPGGQRMVQTLPGSKKAVEEEAAATVSKTKRTQELKDSLSLVRALDRSLAQIAKTTMPNLTLTGFGSYLEYIRGTPANDLARNLDTIKSTLGFTKLQDIRDASASGGALGPVSDFENRLMQATTTSVENSQSAIQIVENMKYLKAMFTDVALQGRLSEIGHRVDSGEINEAQGVQEAGAYLDTLISGVSAAQSDATKDLNDTPPPIMPPPNVSDATKEVWHSMTPKEQERLVEIYKEKEKRNGRN